MIVKKTNLGWKKRPLKTKHKIENKTKQNKKKLEVHKEDIFID